MAERQLPSPELLRKLLRYNRRTGKLHWKRRTGTDRHTRGFNTAWAGKEALAHMNDAGYCEGAVLQNNVLAHRVIVAMVTDEWPDQVDHKNGKRSDNRWRNLRDVTRTEQNRNFAVRHDSKTGVVGVVWSSHAKKWRARIGPKSTHLGYFDTIEAAAKARKKAQKELGYHPNHGRKNHVG